VVGVIIGGYVSFLFLLDVTSQRERHNRFEKLAGSDVVQQERKLAVQKERKFKEAPATLTMEEMFWLESQSGDWKIWKAGGNPSKGGITAIQWGKDFSVESIETDDGQTLHPIPAPPAWKYLLIALFPLLGFFIPWGTIRAIGWVGAGFFQAAK
jgi:hypothetical protein